MKNGIILPITHSQNKVESVLPTITWFCVKHMGLVLNFLEIACY